MSALAFDRTAFDGGIIRSGPDLVGFFAIKYSPYSLKDSAQVEYHDKLAARLPSVRHFDRHAPIADRAA